MADGRYLFGSVDHHRVQRALVNRLCGVCGEALQERLVLMMRLSDLRRKRSSEPALHPWCSAYTVRACPMIAGRQDHYRSSPQKLGPGVVPGSNSSARMGAPAEPWFTVWLTEYNVVTDHGGLAAAYDETQLLRTRPITWSLSDGLAAIGNVLRDPDDE
ncbi:hypothetical protein [Streptomyces sp. NPDC052042]|uniref:hypothetical protein n=1 Tax=Streptomyces sp. NPDC052042 TaxID=3365683 RepID=UPI0037D7D1E1